MIFAIAEMEREEMDKDKAIQLLERLQDPEPYEPMLTKDAYDAIQMAIDALSADGDTISRKAAIEICDHAIDLLKGQFGAGALVAIKESIDELPPTQPEIIYCKDCKKHNKDYHMSPYKDTVCPLTAWRGTARGHEYDYQFCCFAKMREVTT